MEIAYSLRNQEVAGLIYGRYKSANLVTYQLCLAWHSKDKMPKVLTT